MWTWGLSSPLQLALIFITSRPRRVSRNGTVNEEWYTCETAPQESRRNSARVLAKKKTCS